MTMIPEQIPDDLRAEELYDFLKDENCRISVSGSHGRNVYMDIGSLETEGGSVVMNVCRKGLYDSLPEYMFHPVNRFDGISEYEKKQRCAAECDAQRQEIADARQFFSEMDAGLFLLNVDVRNTIRKYTDENRILRDIIGDTLSDTERSNRFISKTLCFLPQCKRIRGNMLLIIMMLRKIFKEEGLTMLPMETKMEFNDPDPSYQDSVDGVLCGMFVGNRFYEKVFSFKLEFWPSSVILDDIDSFAKALEEFRVFLQSYFFGVDECVVFSLVNHKDPVILSDNKDMTWLSYNTNII